MNKRVLELAETVVKRSSRELPADAVLRAELKKRAGFPRELGRMAAGTVFAYYRWFGWVGGLEGSLGEHLAHALSLQSRFDEHPQGFKDAELIARAVPAWIQSEWNVTASWVRSLQHPPRLWLRARPGQQSALAGALVDTRIPELLVPHEAIEYCGHEDLFRVPGFQAGEFEVQDLSSQMVGLLCQPQPGQAWWDACAGEGGKLLHLSDLMGNKGLIWASDRAAWRLKRLKVRTARARVFNYRAVAWDGGTRLPTRTKFDGILVDAPCSGVGTWQRNPHARWTTTAGDVAELSAVQKQLLRHAAPALKPGGRLIYAVCTLTRQETEDVAAYVNESMPELEPLPLTSPFPGVAAQGPHVLLGTDHGSNGMFIAAWRRR